MVVMSHKEAYEKQIAKALRTLPQPALEEVLHLIGVVREKYVTPPGAIRAESSSGRAMHEHTRQLLAVSRSNWAQDLIRDREDRL
jgi:hypothetical protein